MAITFEELQKLVKNEGMRFFVDPHQAHLMLGIAGMFGRYHVLIMLLNDGEFLQIRSVNNLYCRPDHPHWLEVQRVLGALNLGYRLVKFAWDASDGEIIAFADLWLMDNALTQKQLNRIFANFMPALDVASERLRKTIETGKDPGAMRPEDMIKRLAGSSAGLPAALEELLKKLQDGKGSPQDIDEL